MNLFTIRNISPATSFPRYRTIIGNFRWISVIAATVTLLGAEGRAGQCSSKDSDYLDKAIVRAEKTLTSPVSGQKIWSEIRGLFKKYGKCDDGYIAEEISDLAGKLLATRWSTSKSFFISTQGDEKFINFVERHVSMVIPPDDLAQMRHNLETDCPKALKSFCGKILNKLAGVYKEADGLHP